MSYFGEGGLPDIKQRIYRERGQVTLDASGNATITFVRSVPIAPQPFLHMTPWKASGSDPIIVNPIAWVSGAGGYVSVTINAQRVQHLPSGLTLANILGLLSARRVTDAVDMTGVKVDWMLF